MSKKTKNQLRTNGKEYEKFVASLQQAIMNSENHALQKNIEIELNKKITDNCGVKREFDIYWEYELGGITYKTIIECKDYNSNISVEKIDSLIGKTKDLPDIKAVFATKKGYQSGAQIKADHNKIDLLIVREQNDSDWEDENGNPYIKIIDITTHFHLPARITKFIPLADGKWVQENTDIDITKPLEFSERNDKIIIEDVDENKRYSILELENKLRAKHKGEYGSFQKEKKFKNAFIWYENLKIKIVSYKIEYSIPKPLIQPMQIDFSKELIGVIEYLQKGTKKSVFKNGIVR